jgi:hypothetical protein
LTAVAAEDLQTPIARQQFSLGVVAGSLASVLEVGTPLRLWLLRLGRVLSASMHESF